MRAYARERALDRIAELAGHGLDVVAFWRAATDVLAPLVPHYMGPCWYTIDPASLLLTSHFNPAMPELPREWLELEYLGDDVHDLASVARSGSGVSTLHAAAGGDPRRSPRWRANMEMGGDQELLVARRTRSGHPWAALGLYREPGRPLFDEDEIGFIRAAAPMLDEGARRALRTAEGRDAPGEVALARVLSGSGAWIVLHGATLVGEGPTRVAVIVERAHPARITPLLMAAYGLTGREQEVTRLVLQGESTARIAEHLVVSPHTVQEHLKGVFEKTGVRSRRDLVGKVFFSHYEARLRDNERRAAGGLPMRGGPIPPASSGGATVNPRP